MRHRLGLRKLNRTSAHRLAMLRNMTNSLLRHEVIKTTLPKAKELRRVVEPIITLGQKPSLANRRLAFDRLRDREMVVKVFNELGPRFASGRLCPYPEVRLPGWRQCPHGLRRAVGPSRSAGRRRGGESCVSSELCQCLRALAQQKKMPGLPGIFHFGATADGSHPCSFISDAAGPPGVVIQGAGQRRPQAGSWARQPSSSFSQFAACSA